MVVIRIIKTNGTKRFSTRYKPGEYIWGVLNVIRGHLGLYFEISKV